MRRYLVSISTMKMTGAVGRDDICHKKNKDNIYDSFTKKRSKGRSHVGNIFQNKNDTTEKQYSKACYSNFQDLCLSSQ